MVRRVSSTAAPDAIDGTALHDVDLGERWAAEFDGDDQELQLIGTSSVSLSISSLNSSNSSSSSSSSASDSMLPSSSLVHHHSRKAQSGEHPLRDVDVLPAFSTTASDHPKRLSVTVIAMIAALGGLLFGYDIGIIAGAMVQIRDQYHWSTDKVEWGVSGVLVGGAIGSALASVAADRLGRKRLILICALGYIVSAIWVALANSFAMFVTGRVLTGIAVAISAIADCMYTAELSPPSKRGFLVSLNELCIAGGFAVAYLVNYAFAGVHEGWRWMFAIAVGPAVLQAALIVVYPESPRWLLEHGHRDRAHAILVRLRGSVDEATNECRSILHHIDSFTVKDDDSNGSHKERLVPSGSSSSSSPPPPPTSGTHHSRIMPFRERLRLCFAREWWPMLFSSIGLVVFQQLSGQPTVLYYAPQLFQRTGFIGSNAILANVAVGSVKFFVTGLCIWKLDSFGRKPLLLIGSGAMTVSIGIMAGALLSPISQEIQSWVTLVGLMIFVSGYSISYGPMGWLFMSEVFPQHIRSIAMSAATIVNWLTNLLVAITFLDVIHWLHGIGYVLLMYCVINALGWLFLFRFIPETKGKSLEEMHQCFRRR